MDNKKVQVNLIIDSQLLELIKMKAKAEGRSMNKYVEKLLHRELNIEPNETTLKAITEARQGHTLERIADTDKFLDSL